ncbi:ethanolamine utilization protein EutJ [Proteiniclasticum sp. BAD-10]|uniref:Chaperone protein DnaK n=1 Tax=Proteiniclasticum sediminis TaxID=2804028 RepID=A0A941HQX7_9CLOT|nr:ethanolamine utilization protein EutJ [Proteiniclasticum sediminis]MBR0575622.1 ethanolamine utilization protein EutJ [Proteiniclasticum sediminis]
MDMEKVNERILAFEGLIGKVNPVIPSGELYTGVDLGTASIVLCVVDEAGNLVTGAFQRGTAVRDGIVVDFVGAVDTVRRMKRELEQLLGRPLVKGAGAIPPGVSEGSAKIVRNVLEAAGFTVVNIVDEPTAAAQVLEVTEGAVVDIGGGTTGISILKDEEVLDTYDEATGGHHMNLVISGSYGIPYEEAEALKCSLERQGEIYHVVLPVIDKMARIVKTFLGERAVEAVYLVGGGSALPGFEEYFAAALGIRTLKPYNPMLVTPMGIALCARKGGG